MSAYGAEAFGQLLMVRIEEDRWKASCERLLRACRPGGMLLGAGHLRTPDATAELLGKLACALEIPPFLAIEEEGGRVDPLRAFFPPLPSARATAPRGLSAVARLGELVGASLNLLGFNTNFAPLLDVSTPLSEPLLGDRAFSSDPHEVARCGEAFVRGLRRHKVLACAKHFPGLGSAQAGRPSHPPEVGKTMAELWREDLVPYRKLLGQLPLVLVSHGTYKAYDFDHPRSATLSLNVVEGLLRVKLGYRGVAVADGLETAAIRPSLNLAEAALQSIMAGCDLLLVSPREESIEAILAGLKKGLESGELPAARLEQAVERMRRAKKGIAPPKGKISKAAWDKLAQQFENFRKECQSGGEEDCLRGAPASPSG